MKIFSYVLLLAIVLIPALTFAQGFGSPVLTPAATNIPESELTTLANWYELVQQVIGWLFTIAVILGVIILIIAGIMYITSGGSARAQTAGNMIIYAVVGIAVAALAWAIVNLVGNFFTGGQIIS